MTVVVVTHRSTLTQHVDKMLVLEAGKAVQYGPVPDVMKAMQAKAAAADAAAARWCPCARGGHAAERAS